MSTRTRGDLCPGVLRPWLATDGMLVRLRLIGGLVPAASLRALADVALEYGDGRIHLPARPNLPLRALPGSGSTVDPEALAAIEATGLLPTRSHELVRNVMVSPRPGGLVDLRPVAAELDALLCADPRLASLPGRFLFVLDDGSGDLVDRACDLGLVAVSSSSVQLRVGDVFGPVVPVSDAAAALAELAHAFAVRRGTGPAAPWHVAELPDPLVPAVAPDPRLPSPAPALPFGPRHLAFPEGLDRDAVHALPEATLVVTPWRGVLIPEETP